ASSPKTNNKTNEFYPTSLSPIKHLLNESIDSNIEIIQMDEQECILEIVNGVLTIVPKDKSTSSSSSSSSLSNSRNKRHEQQNINYNSSKARTSSIASSNSTPSLSEQEQERDESSSLSSSKPYTVVRDVPSVKLTSPSPSYHSGEVVDLFSTPIGSTNSTIKTKKNLLDDSLSSVSSCGIQTSEKKKSSTGIPRSSSPIQS
ncbi:unnamed protein product, partial [Adineta ricciae]